MAITKLKPIYKTLNTSIEYSINYEKTFEKNSNNILVSTFNCTENSAEFDFIFTQNLAKQIKGDYSKVGGNNILAWHIIQSFSPTDNITSEQAHIIGKELADNFLDNKYQYVLATHLDKGHLHNHIIFNSTSFKNFNKFDTKVNKEFFKLREISNNICERNNLSTIDLPPLNEKYNRISNSKKTIEADISKKDNSFKSQLKNDINSIINNSINFDDFIQRMQNLGYDIIDDKNGLGFKNKHQKYCTRLKSLGSVYSKNKLENIIQNNKSLNSKLEKTPVKIDSISVNYINQLLEPKEVLKSNISWRAKLKYCIDYYIFKSNNFDEFLKGMQDVGYTIKFGKHISFRCIGMDKNIRAKVLGDDYTEENIKNRILESKKPLPKIPFIQKEIKNNKSLNNDKISIKSVINTTNNDKFKNNIAYKKFVEKFNADQTIATMNFMREHNYNDNTLQLAIEHLQKEILLDKKELASIEKDFEKLNSIERTNKNAKDYDEAFENLTNLKNKISNRLENNSIKLLEHKTVQKNRNIGINKTQGKAL